MMIPRQIPGAFRTLLCSLRALFLLLLLGWPVWSLVRGEPDYMWPLPVRLGESAVLVVCAFAWALGTRGWPLGGYPWLLLGGMTLGHLGDWNIGRMLGLSQPVVLGMMIFGAGHILYMIGYSRLASALALHDRRAVATGIAIYLVVATLMWWLLVQNPEKGPVMNLGALGYGLLLGAMGGWAAGLAAQDCRFLGLAVGGVLFMVSDVILGAEALRGIQWDLQGETIWITYIVGQTLIVFSPGRALQVFESRGGGPQAIGSVAERPAG